MEIPEIPEISEIPEEPEEKPESEPELNLEGLNLEELEIPEIPVEPEAESESEAELNLDELEIPDIPEIPDEKVETDAGINIDGLDEAIQSETELEMAGQLDDNLDDVLSMLDDDAELAEINDMLKKSDNNEQIQDDMMDLLNQMADDEAASVNAGADSPDDDDGGIPLPKMPKPAEKEEIIEEASDKDEKKKKNKKASKKKVKNGDDSQETEKKPGAIGKFFNMLTEDLVPEPTEEELAAEKEAKEAKKQENLTKKEQDKLAKEEAKKAKAEEKEAAKKAKAEAAAAKKAEKQAAKEKKAAEKKAKQAAEPKRKRISPKKLAAVAVFGASVGGAVIVSTNVLSNEGYLQTARKAFYNKDYKTVYQATYGMKLDDSKSDGLIQAKSEVILKLQCRYDSYQNNLKMGRNIEALDALLQGIVTYDNINADAEKYGVSAEVDAIKANILNTLQAKYGLDETAARELINIDDSLSYTLALDGIVSGN